MRVGVEDDVPDLVRLVALIGDRMRLVREGVAVGVRGIGTGERAVEGVVRDRVERVRQFGRLAAGLDDREGAPGEADDIGVWRVEAFGAGAGRNRLAELCAGLCPAHPAVALPQRLAARSEEHTS